MKENENYHQLIDYYNDCFSFVDFFHFNSDVSKMEYERVLGAVHGKTIMITHSDIKDRRRVKLFSGNGLVLGFIGSGTPYKGLSVLCNAIKGLNVDLMVWGGRKKECGRVHYRGKYSASKLHEVYDEMDLLVVPSIWKETFSFVALEALSFGVPVLVSDNVGAQDIIKEYASSFVYHSSTDLRNILEILVRDKTSLVEYNKKILDLPWNHDLDSHVEDIIENIYK